MAVDDGTDAQHIRPHHRHPVLRRVLIALGVLALLLAVLVIPPYVSVNRYSRHVAASISAAIGRPVHFDSIEVHLLPLPSLTITNFVVAERSDFGFEPVLRANTVSARLRFSSLFRRHIEVSKITLDAPSINLVRNAAGAWNFQNILRDASQMNSAPTGQRGTGPAPRFPYIEASGARVNLVLDGDKQPFSVREADFSLWLPDEAEWHLRFSGRPVRTDTDVSDVGLLDVEGVLGRNAVTALSPVSLQATWHTTPLGEFSKIAAGTDTGWRGSISATVNITGTLNEARVTSDIALNDLRRADFVPADPPTFHAHCTATATGTLRALHALRCTVPTVQSTSFLDTLIALAPGSSNPSGPATSPSANAEAPPGPGILLLRGEVPSLLNWTYADLSLGVEGTSPDLALNLARLFTQRIPPALHVTGAVSLFATHPALPGGGQWTGAALCDCTVPADFLPTPATASAKSAEAPPTPNTKDGAKDTPKDVAGLAAPMRWIVRLSHDADETPDAGRLTIEASTIATGATPGTLIGPANTQARARSARLKSSARPATSPLASDSITGQADSTGYTLTYNAPSTARLAAALLPPLGDGLPAGGENSTPLQATRAAWSAPQSWTEISPSKGTRRKETKR